MNQASRKSCDVPVFRPPASPEIGLVRGADRERLVHHLVHHRDVALIDHAAERPDLAR